MIWKNKKKGVRKMKNENIVVNEGSVLAQHPIDNFFIPRMEYRYKLNKQVNTVGRKLKQTGEYVKIAPMFEYPFSYKGIEYYLIYTYLLGLMIKDPEGGYKTRKTKFFIREMELKFNYKFTFEELEKAYKYLVDNEYLVEIWDAVKYQEGPKSGDCDIWITCRDAIYTFEAMMQEKESKNKNKKKGE